MKVKKRYLALVLLLGLMGFIGFGPRPDFPAFDAKPIELSMGLGHLDDYLARKEANIDQLKANNQSQIIWYDSIRKTPYSIVYLHGFSASPMEAEPLHLELAQRFGCNLYLPRLAGHGIDNVESFKDLTPKALIDSAKEALAIGQLLGEKVILLSCSTGSTLSIFLSATQPESVAAQIMYSPNINLYDDKSTLLTAPWGLQLARWMNGGDYRSFELPEGGKQYWTTTYRLEGLVCLRDLLDRTMTPENFAQIQQPYFIGYYYKSEEESDHIISIPAIQDFAEQTQTPEDQKVLKAFPGVDTHVLPSKIQSKNLAAVQAETFRYVEEVLKLRPVESVAVEQ